MTTEERLEMLHLSIESVYREHFRAHGVMWADAQHTRTYPVPHSYELDTMWGQVEALERQIGVVK